MGGRHVNEHAQQLAEIELEPLDGERLRGWEATEAWETFRGKVNRISIGLPRWQLSGHTAHVTPGDRPGPADDQRGNGTSATMSLDLTLLPDLGCRFTNAELAVRLEPGAGCDQAVLARLEPTELADQAVVVREIGGGMKASLGQVIDAGVELSRTQRQEVTRTLVRVAAFGAGTSEAGWRLTLTDARDIPLNTMDLTTTIAHPPAWRGTVWFSVVAQIQVRSRTDRWLTAAFGMRDSARLRCSQPFPP
jgi:hypothetical protein